MSIGSISAAGLSQDVYLAGYSTQQQVLQSLQSNLASGNLTGATAAFQSLQSVLQNSATSTGSTAVSSNPQLTTDLTTLGSALSSGNLSTARSAFATVTADLKTTASSAQINEANAASQSVQLIADLLSSLNASVGSSSSSSLDATTSLLQNVYGAQGGLNVYA